MDGRTDGQMDDSDFIGCCPTYVERPVIFKFNFSLFSIKFNKITYSAFQLFLKDCFWAFELVHSIYMLSISRNYFLKWFLDLQKTELKKIT